MNRSLLDLGTGLFFFASDETVRGFSDWKARSMAGELEGIELIRQMGQLMVSLRKDVGYLETTLTEDDFLRSFVTDWH